MPEGFIKLFRGKAMELLETNYKAYLLLSQIALRARREDALYSGLKANEAFIGDHEKIGLSRQEYRTAQKFLEKNNLARFTTTNKGTIATLTCTDIFDINACHSEQPSNFSIENREKEPTDNQQGTIQQPLTRMKELKKEILKEKPLHHSSPEWKKPEDLEKWKKKMMSLGWTEEEFNEAQNKFLEQPPGHVKNPRKWLEPVMQSIRDAKEKEKSLQEITAAEAEKKRKETEKRAETARVSKEIIAKQRADTILKNKTFFENILKKGIGKEKYEMGTNYVKLIGEPGNGFCLGFEEPDFIQTISEHLGLNNQEKQHDHTKTARS